MLCFALLSILIFVAACNKETSNPANNTFTAGAAKEWYYGTFKRSPGWTASNQKGKKLPDWKHAIIGKIGNSDVVEFPLVKGSKAFPIPGGNSLSPAEKKKIADASLSRILFIKAGNKILVREVDYIPGWNYLQKNQFDISKNSLTGKNDFTGMVVVKEWNGTVLRSVIYENGKAVRIGKRSAKIETTDGKGNQAEEEQCTYYELCIWQQDCVLTIYGDGMTTFDCEQWFNTGQCWTEEFCVETDPCVIAPESCDGGGGDPPGGCENQDCSVAESILAGITTETPNTVTYTIGSETGPDANGIIRKKKDPKWDFFKLNLIFNYSVRFTANFTGWVYRLHTGSSWKWESLAYIHTSRTGNTPMCIDVNDQVNCMPPVISLDEKKAVVAAGYLTWDIDVKIDCILSFQTRNFTDANSLDMEFLSSN